MPLSITVSSKKETAEIVRDNLRSYGFYVIEDRAIADGRDGLKPVQRRTLWALHELKRHSKAIPVKCAQVVGSVIGRYHPHGDSACYGALVNMGWLRQPLIEKHGNFGGKTSLMDEPPAPYRYTETQLTEFADRLFDDIHVMPLMKSYTEEHDEPILLPTRVPMVLVNGSSGVAVGMSTNIPPHNLGEVINATLHTLKNPECTTDELLKHIKGPDSGAGVLLSRKAELRELYETGQGKLTFSCNYRFEEGKRGRQKLVITGLDPGFTSKKATKLLNQTQKLADAKLLVSAANDEGSMDVGTRIVVEFTDPKIVNDRVLPLLKSSVSYQFYVLDSKKRPRLCGLKKLIQVFINFRRKVEKLVLQTEQEELQKKLEADQARYIAVQNLSLVMKIINSANSMDEILRQLENKLELNERQAQVLLDTTVRGLVRKLNEKKLGERIDQHKKRLGAVADDLENIDGVVERRLQEMLKYADKRGTRLRGGKEDLDVTAKETTYYVGVTPQGKFDSFSEPPVKSRAAWPYVNLVATPSKFAVVSEDNIGQSASLSFPDKFDKNVATILGVASENDDCMLVITANGDYVAFPPDQRRTQFMVFKEMPEHDIIFAGAVNQDDTVVIQSDDEEILLQGEEFKITRPNVKGKRLPGIGRKKVEVLAVRVAKADTQTYLGDGTEIDAVDILDDPSATTFSVGESNLVVLGDGRRAIKSAEATVAALEKMKVSTIVPIPVENDDA